jgi:deoxycytidylate deaminase
VIKGPCAKHRVICTLVTVSGEHIVGENWCSKPQATCPRKAGENYDKCITICGQSGHAETVALALAGKKASGARAYVEGRPYSCRDCQESMYAAGVRAVTCGMPPPAPVPAGGKQRAVEFA